VEGGFLSVKCKLQKMGKYTWFKDSFFYTVEHKGEHITTIIAITDSAEKADFICKACNDFDIEQHEQTQKPPC